MTVFDEILTTAKAGNGGQDQRPGQPDQVYLLSLVKCIQSCPEEQWKALSQPARDWFNLCVRASNGMKPLSEPEGFKKKVEDRIPGAGKDIIVNVAPDFDAPMTIVEDKPKPKTVSIPAVKTVAQIGQVKDKSKKEKQQGVLNAIRKTVIEHLDWSTKQVHQHLLDNGYPEIKLDIVAVNAGDIRRVVACVKDLGHWQEKNDKVQEKTAS